MMEKLILDEKVNFPQQPSKFGWLFVSSIINLIIHVIVALIYFNPIDFVLQVETARRIAQGEVLYRDIGQILFEGALLPNPQYPPLYLYTLALVILIIGVNTFTFEMAKILIIIFNFLLAFLLYYLIKSYFGHKLALFSFNFFLLNPSTLGVVFGGYHENFMLFFVVLGYLLFSRNKLAIAGVLFGLALLVKPTTVVYMFPLIIWGINKRDLTTIRIWIISGLVFFLGSLPFLIIAPVEYVTDVFLIHSSRMDPSMSLYNYIFTELSPTLFPFIFQILILILIGGIILNNKVLIEPFEVIELILPFMTLFLAFNRILYPHYIPNIFPFFTWSLILVINRYRDNTKSSIYLWEIIGLLIGLGITYIGYIWWSILWSIESYQTYLENIFFPISAFICIFGLLLISTISIWSVLTSPIHS
ncbi:MAG: glycosyltransferase 87 family protein [Candidatus Hodarchaeales archaeon]